jgi:hypothetical protein
MNRVLSLTPPEWDAIYELIEAGARQLSIEVQHTSTRRYKEDLRHRLDMLTTLMVRMDGAPIQDEESEALSKH